jgi:hypothetical protein
MYSNARSFELLKQAAIGEVSMGNHEQDWYKGVPDSYTALLFGEVAEGHLPQMTRLHLGQEAYEAYQTYIYMKELLQIRRTDLVCWTPGFGFLYSALAAMQKRGSVDLEEIGPTLFATIDKLEKCRTILSDAHDLKSVRFIGVEVSNLFVQIAEELHQGYQLLNFQRAADLPHPGAFTLGRSYQATSYAFDSTTDFAGWLDRCRFSLNGAWFSADDEMILPCMGKQTTLFGIDRLKSILSERGQHLALISSDRYTLGKTPFYSVWFIAHRLQQDEYKELIELAIKHPDLGCQSINLIDEFSQAKIKEISRECGPHAGFTYNEESSTSFSNPTLDFGNADNLRKFSEYVAKIKKTARFQNLQP